jgi:hypothetical protein
MPGQLDSVLRPVAANLIEQFGMGMTYIRTTEAFNAVTGKTVVTEVSTSIVGTPPVPLSKRLASGESFRAVLGETFDTVEAGDLITTVKALGLGFVPVIGDKINFNASVWQIVRIDPLYSGALAAAYVVQMRQ